MVSRVLQSLEQFFKSHDLKVLMDPMPIKSAEPHIRLSFSGVEDAVGRDVTLTFTCSVLGAGDGPGVFVESVIETSIKLHKIIDGERHYKLFVDAGDVMRATEARLYFTPAKVGSGQLVEVEQYDNETTQFNYVYTESHNLKITFEYEE